MVENSNVSIIALTILDAKSLHIYKMFLYLGRPKTHADDTPAEKRRCSIHHRPFRSRPRRRNEYEFRADSHSSRSQNRQQAFGLHQRLLTVHGNDVGADMGLQLGMIGEHLATHQHADRRVEGSLADGTNA